MFSLPEFTKVKVLDVHLLSQKNRPPGANPGVRLNVQADLPNYALAAFDPALRTALFTKTEAAGGSAKDKRQTLPGVEEISDLPHLTSMARHIKKVPWTEKLTGYTGEIDHGVGGKSNLPITDASLENWRFQAKQGGTVATWWSIEMVDVPKLVLAELAMLKSREVPLKLLEPEVRQQQLDDGAEQRQGAATPPASAPAAQPQGDGNGAWPFPNDPPGSTAAAPASRRKANTAKTAEEVFAEESKA